MAPTMQDDPSTKSPSEAPGAGGPSRYARMQKIYEPTGDSGRDRLEFFHVIERLKTQKRTGWLNNEIPNAESISDHMHRMSILALCLEDDDLDAPKCSLLAAVHDIAEAQVGDIAPSDGVSKADKRAMEEAAMQTFMNNMLRPGSKAAERIYALWKEYEAQETPEARVVKDIDLFEMALQAMEYERSSGGAKRLDPFFESSIPRIRHPEVQRWASDLMKERTEFWAGNLAS